MTKRFTAKIQGRHSYQRLSERFADMASAIRWLESLRADVKGDQMWIWDEIENRTRWECRA